MSIKAHQMMAWLSPAFPTGGFAYSHGLEQAVDTGQVTDAAALQDWLAAILTHGSAWNDAVLLCHAYQGNDVSELATTLAGSKERLEETAAQGRAFAKTASALLPQPVAPAPLPVAVGQAAALAGLPVSELLPLYLHSFNANLIHAGIRLIPLGQTEGQVILQNLFETMEATAAKAQSATLDDLGTATWVADIAAMRHEDMTTRIFRT